MTGSQEWISEPGPSRSPLRRASSSSSSLPQSLRRPPPPPPLSADLKSSGWSQSRKYAILVDAGSSGSRLQVYSWKDPKVSRQERIQHGQKLKVLPKVEKGTRDGSGQEWQWKVEPGISSFATHPQDIPTYFEPLFQHAQTIIPRELIAETPVYIMATAGMRFLPASQQDDIIQATCRYISKQTPFQIHGNCKEHVQVITGEEEGLLGWIAINYLMDGFHFKEGHSDVEGTDGVKSSKGKSTYGFLDMGGASTQIAFEPSKKALAVAESTSSNLDEELAGVTLKLLDGTEVTHDVFVTTFLGFGTNKARERYETALRANSTISGSSTATLPDPCLPKGAAINGISASTPSLQGTGSFQQCLTSLSPLLDKSAHCSHPPCLFHGIHVPPIDFSVNHFIGVSEYWFSSHDVFNLGGAYDYVTFQRAAEKFCKRPWSELQAGLHNGQTGKGSAEFPAQVDESRLKMQCFKSAWMVTVLHEGIGLPRVIDSHGKGDGKHHADDVEFKAGEKNLAGDNQDVFQSVNEVEGTAVSWTLGKAVLEATKDIEDVKTISSGQAQDHGGRPLPPWYAPSSGSVGSHLPDAVGSVSPGLSAVVAIVLLFGVIIALALFIATRGRSPAAIRRRNGLRSCLPTAFWRRDSRPSTGDYGLANMEEGADTVLTGTDGRPLLQGAADAMISETSSSEEDSAGSGNLNKLSGVHRRRRSSGGLLSLLPIQLRSFALKTASFIPGTASAARRAQRQRHRRRRRDPKLRSSMATTMEYDGYSTPDGQALVDDEMQLRSVHDGANGIRRAFSPNVMRESRAASPALSNLPPNVVGSAISRPASRAALMSGRQSPRMVSTGGGSASLSLTPLTMSPPVTLPHQQASGTSSFGFQHLRPTSPSYFGTAAATGSPVAVAAAAPPNGGHSVPIAWTSSSSHNPSAAGTGASTPRVMTSLGPGAPPSLASISAAMQENEVRSAARRAQDPYSSGGNRDQ